MLCSMCWSIIFWPCYFLTNVILLITVPYKPLPIKDVKEDEDCITDFFSQMQGPSNAFGICMKGLYLKKPILFHDSLRLDAMALQK